MLWCVINSSQIILLTIYHIDYLFFYKTQTQSSSSSATSTASKSVVSFCMFAMIVCCQFISNHTTNNISYRLFVLLQNSNTIIIIYATSSACKSDVSLSILCCVLLISLIILTLSFQFIASFIKTQSCIIIVICYFYSM